MVSCTIFEPNKILFLFTLGNTRLKEDSNISMRKLPAVEVMDAIKASPKGTSSTVLAGGSKPDWFGNLSKIWTLAVGDINILVIINTLKNHTVIDLKSGLTRYVRRA